MATFLSAANLSPERRIPGYGGFCPTVRTNYGSTYGNATQKFFLMSTRIPLKQAQSEGDAISITSSFNRPRTAANRTACAWTAHRPYTLYLDGARRNSITSFDKEAQLYRNHYKDHSGMIQNVLNIPRTQNMEQRLGLQPFYQFHSGDGLSKSLPARGGSHCVISSRRGSAKERSTRDAFFEKR